MTTEVFAVGGPELSRRAVFGGAVAGLAVLVSPACSSKESTTTATSVPANAKEAFSDLDAKIDKAMRDYTVRGLRWASLPTVKRTSRVRGHWDAPESRHRPMAGRRCKAATSVVIFHHSDERLPGVVPQTGCG